MSAYRQFVEAVKAYAQPRGLDAEFEDDQCLWQTGDGFTLTIQIDAEGSEAVLSTPIGLWPPADDADHADGLRILLAANLMGVGSRGAVFAIDDEAGEVIAYRRLACGEVTAESLAQAIDDLYATGVEFTEKAALPVLS